MKNNKYDLTIKQFAVDTAAVPEGQWIVLHVDGDNFSTFTELFDKPFDLRLYTAMQYTAHSLMSAFEALAGYTQFDEISLLLDKDTTMFKRDIGKLISKASALATLFFSKEIVEEIVAFSDVDRSYEETYQGFATHVYGLPTIEEVGNYFKWRELDAIRNSVNAFCYWHLVNDKTMSSNQAAKTLSAMKMKERLAFLKDNNIDIDKVPIWQKYGSILVWDTYDKIGFNPLALEYSCVSRREVKTIESKQPTHDIMLSLGFGK
jgi:tRNA(His) guanylyltransferase